MRRGRHRDVQGSGARAAVLGAGDGLQTNVSLVLGVAGANPSASTVRLAGLAGLLAGAFSMAAGELVSVRAQGELAEHEIDVERHELADDPRGEQAELARMYESRGLSREKAETVAAILMSDENVAVGAFIPLFPWLFWSGSTAIVLSIVLGAAAALALGAAVGAFTGAGVLSTALRQLAAAVIAASVTYAVGALLGTSTT